MKANLIYHHKARIQGHYILELKIHDVGKSARYRDGIKYGLICIDEETGKRILMDNHHPKGDHVHIDNSEFPYEFKSVDKLIEDFQRFVFNHMGVKI